jgi:hypothetical protein
MEEHSRGRFAHFPGLTPRGSALPLSGAAFAEGDRGYKDEDPSESMRAATPSLPYASLSSADISPTSSNTPILSPPQPETESQLTYTQSLAPQAGAGAPLPPAPPSAFSSSRNRNLARTSMSTTSRDENAAPSSNDYPSDSEKGLLASSFDTSSRQRNSAALSQSDGGSGSDPSTTGYGGIEPVAEGEPVSWRWTLMRVPVYGDEASSSARSVELPSYTAATAR